MEIFKFAFDPDQNTLQVKMQTPCLADGVVAEAAEAACIEILARSRHTSFGPCKAALLKLLSGIPPIQPEGASLARLSYLGGEIHDCPAFA